MASPPESESPPVSVQLSNVRALDDGRVAFTATIDNMEPDQWTGQEWVVLLGDTSPWAIPMHVNPGGRTIGSVAWFPGQASPSSATATQDYAFDILAPSLAVREDSGIFAPIAGSSRALGDGAWTLAIRLQHEWQPNHWRQAAFIPVLRIRISETGETSYTLFDDVLDASSSP